MTKEKVSNTPVASKKVEKAIRNLDFKGFGIDEIAKSIASVLNCSINSASGVANTYIDGNIKKDIVVISKCCDVADITIKTLFDALLKGKVIKADLEKEYLSFYNKVMENMSAEEKEKILEGIHFHQRESQKGKLDFAENAMKIFTLLIAIVSAINSGTEILCNKEETKRNRQYQKTERLKIKYKEKKEKNK